MTYKAGGAKRFGLLLVMVTMLLGGCASDTVLRSDGDSPRLQGRGSDYLIGPGDELQVFVWRNEELSVTVPVRPDGKITTPLVDDIEAVGKSPSELARNIEERLARYIKKPIVSVIVTGFVGPFNQQIRVIGEATEPQALPYRENMTLLDVMIEVGGLTEFAAGNRAKLIRRAGDKTIQYNVRLEDLIKDGDIGANVTMLPGDIVLIPESWF